ncbi:hypothetical protein B0H13DRAFT_2305165 [Mycena leptocephala]|nr:hypothetical protein B0H13DRAFT_2305165 [Mycena leptocephala]
MLLSFLPPPPTSRPRSGALFVPQCAFSRLVSLRPVLMTLPAAADNLHAGRPLVASFPFVFAVFATSFISYSLGAASSITQGLVGSGVG